MPSPRLNPARIRTRLQQAHLPGRIASVDGYPEFYRDAPLRCAAVLVPLLRRAGRWHLLLTRRTESVEHHKGQVAFPGGACDPSESSPEETALREAHEEIGLHPSAVQVLGRLDTILTITRYQVTPVVGLIPWPYDFHPSTGEVARCFTIPLAWLADHHHRQEQPFSPQGQPRPFPVIVFQSYNREVLWGASARITLHLLAALGFHIE